MFFFFGLVLFFLLIRDFNDQIPIRYRGGYFRAVGFPCGLNGIPVAGIPHRCFLVVSIGGEQCLQFYCF